MFGKGKKEKTIEEQLQKNQGLFALQVVGELYVLYMVYHIYIDWRNGEVGNVSTSIVFTMMAVLLIAAVVVFCFGLNSYKKIKKNLEEKLDEEAEREKEIQKEDESPEV